MRNRALYALLAAAVALYVARAWPSRDTVVDDAYISARYAEQLWRGNGLSFNADGPWIEGYTNLLWTLWLAPWHGTNASIHAVMVNSGLVFGALTVVFVGLLAETLARGDDHAPALGAATLASLLMALDPHLAVVGTNGLESSMFAAWVVGACWATLRREPRLRPLAFALVASVGWVRPEGAAVGLALGLADLAWRGWRSPASYRLLAAAIGGPLLLTGWRLVVYGRLVPNTFDAKAKRTPFELLDGNLQLLAPEQPFWWIAALMTLLAPLWAWRDQRRWWTVAIAAGLVLVAFRVPMWMPGGRLLVPSLALGVALVGAVVNARTPARLAWGAVAFGLMVAAAGAHVERHTRDYDAKHSALPDNGAERAARHLRRYAPADATLTVRDAGVFAYFVGPDVHVHETHPRALTLPHVDRADAEVVALAPKQPTFLVLTVNRPDRTDYYYAQDRQILTRAQADYHYLGRIEQHYRRYYDIYARVDANVPPLPAAWVVNQLGPTPPRVTRLPPAGAP